MFNARSFTSNGFIRRKDLDFGDDGNYFKGYEYKGMPITYLRCKEQIRKFDEEKQQYIYLDEYEYRCYISVRVDYVEWDNRDKFHFTTKDMLNAKWYRDCDKFNGVNEDVVNIDELKEIVDNAWTGLYELNEKVINEPINYKKLQDRLSTEIYKGNLLLEKFKTHFNCFDRELTEWDLEGYRRNYNNLEDYVKRCVDTLDTMHDVDLREQRYLVQNLDKYGYVIFNHDSYFVKDILKYLQDKNVIDNPFGI